MNQASLYSGNHMPYRKHIAQAPHVKGKTLDIGYAEYPNRHCGELHGLDIVPKPDTDLPNYLECKIADLNTDAMPYDDEEFDTVIINDVIEHVVNPMALLCETNRILKPGGTIIVSTPNPYYYWEFMQNMLVNFKFMKAVQEGHFTTFTRVNMRTIFKRTGFDLVKEIGNHFTLIVLKWTWMMTKMPFLTYQITYIGKKVGEPEHYMLTKPEGKAMQVIKTNLNGTIRTK